MRSLKKLTGLLQTESASPDEIRDYLWSSRPSHVTDKGSWEIHQRGLLEQYRIYTEMADRVSARRALTNTFFLTLNTAILTTAGTLLETLTSTPSIAALIAAIGILQSITWFWLIRSYRQLNGAKYTVISVLEERLPAAPYRCEWVALGEGKSKARYWPLTHLEEKLPCVFSLVYATGWISSLALA